MMLSRNRQRPIRSWRRNFHDNFTSNELEMMMHAIHMIRLEGMGGMISPGLDYSDGESDDYYEDSEYYDED